VECPTGSGRFLSIGEVAEELSGRLKRIFLKDRNGLRPVFGHQPRLQRDAHFVDYVHFYEYFHGDTGRGVGASHQTGWTGLIAKLLMPRYASKRLDIKTDLQLKRARPGTNPFDMNICHNPFSQNFTARSFG